MLKDDFGVLKKIKSLISWYITMIYRLSCMVIPLQTQKYCQSGYKCSRNIFAGFKKLNKGFFTYLMIDQLNNAFSDKCMDRATSLLSMCSQHI